MSEKLKRVVRDLNDQVFAYSESYRQEREYNEKLERKNERYKQALVFYADKDNYKVNVTNQWEPAKPVIKDSGLKARQSLAGDTNDTKNK